jgi:hypothetical protein
MKRMNWSMMGCAAVALLLAAMPAAAADYALSLGTGGDGTAREGSIPLSVTSADPVEGFVAAVGFDGTKVEVTDIDKADILSSQFHAELVVKEIFANGFTLGVVLDVDSPFEGQTIPVGTHQVALIDVRTSGCSETPQEVAFAFQDMVFGTPPLLNLIVIGGESKSAAEGLALQNGAVRVPACAPQQLIVEQTVLAEDATSGAVRIMVDNREPVEGFIVSLAHDQGVQLDSIDIRGTATQSAVAEFAHEVIYPGQGGTFGVVLDFDPPYAGQTIPVTGHTMHIANYNFTYNGPALAPGASAKINLNLVDNVFGTPKLQNMLVQGGLSVFPQLVNGSITFKRGTVIEESDVDFYVNVDGRTISPGGCAEIGYYYTSKTKPIQGISIASCFDPRLTVGTINLDGSITAAVNAEFVNHHAANGQLIVGILVDSTPPVSVDRMFPSTDTPTLVCRIQFCASAAVNCGETLPISFCNGAVGAGSVPIKNRAAIFNESVPANLHTGQLSVTALPYFKRGDCNFDGEVDIADPAAIMSYVFLGVYHPRCLDACDANDDGVVDLADTVKVLRFLFKFGAQPPAPGPFVAGPDPTPDVYGLDLGCDAGDTCP